MSANSKIEWTDASANPIKARNKKTGKIGWYCEHASDGCKFCYAEHQINKRFGTGLPYKPGHRDDVELFLDEDVLGAIQRWQRPRMIFLCSMTDLFADFVPDPWIDRILEAVDPGQAWDGRRWVRRKRHQVQILTKRTSRMRQYMQARYAKRKAYADEFKKCPTPAMRDSPAASLARQQCDPAWDSHLWLGASAEDQANYDARREDLENTPAAVRFWSLEPLLGPIRTGLEPVRVHHHPDNDRSHPALETVIQAAANRLRPIHWVIVGGESGPKARPMHPDWVRAIHDECTSAGVPFFFKQWGAWLPVYRDHYGGTDGPAYFPAISVDPHYQGDALERVGKTCGDARGSGTLWARVGKKAAGRLLDGREWNEMPRMRGIA